MLLIYLWVVRVVFSEGMRRVTWNKFFPKNWWQISATEGNVKCRLSGSPNDARTWSPWINIYRTASTMVPRGRLKLSSLQQLYQTWHFFFNIFVYSLRINRNCMHRCSPYFAPDCYLTTQLSGYIEGSLGIPVKQHCLSDQTALYQLSSSQNRSPSLFTKVYSIGWRVSLTWND